MYCASSSASSSRSGSSRSISTPTGGLAGSRIKFSNGYGGGRRVKSLQSEESKDEDEEIEVEKGSSASYMDKDAKWHKLNEELEKTSATLFQRIEDVSHFDTTLVIIQVRNYIDYPNFVCPEMSEDYGFDRHSSEERFAYANKVK